MLLYIIGIPVLASLIIFLTPPALSYINDTNPNRKNSWLETINFKSGGKSILNITSLLEARKIGLLSMIISLLLFTYIWSGFNSSYGDGFQYELAYDKDSTSVNMLNILSLGVDGLSIFFLLLTALIMPIAFLSNWENITSDKNKERTYTILMLLIDTLLLTNFIVLDILGFYVLFESFLAPLFILICLYGSQNKERAAYYLLIFTLMSSLFMLIQIAIIGNLINSTSYNIIYNYIFDLDLQSILWIGIFIAIMVKTPVFSTHVWLSVVHSESFLGGSVILAGIILKLAIYTIIRLLLPLLSEANVLFIPLVFVISVITVIYTSLATIRQIDTKALIAYSSIGHMSICLLGIFCNNLLGIEGSLLLSIAHGFCSPALFIIIGGILYDRYHHRCITYYKGLINIMPRLTTYFFIFSLANSGTPLTANFLGEFLSLAGAIQRSPVIAVFAISSVLLSALYTMFFYSRISAGSFSKYFYVTKDISQRETTLLNVLLFPLLLLGVLPNFFFDTINYGSSTLIYTIL